MEDVLKPTESRFLKGDWLFSLLCLVTFLATITTGRNVFDNAWLIFGYEAVFVIGFLVWKVAKGLPEHLFPTKSVGFWLMMVWFGSITLSLMFSPYGLMMEWFAVQRYLQTVFHILFFLGVHSFLIRYRGSLSPLFLSIGVSVFILALIFIGAWQGIDTTQELDRKFWYLHPPLNAHIRITDFLATAGASLFLPFFFYGSKECGIGRTTVLVGIATVVWGFLFWCGGRGGIFSAMLAVAFLLIVLKFKRVPISKVTVLIILVVMGGVLLAKIFSVFPWNGLGGATERTLKGGTDIYRLSNSRLDYWAFVLGVLGDSGSYVFGLGSAGLGYASYILYEKYYILHPHNLVFQFLAEWGVVGTILSLSLLVWGFVQGWKNHVFGVMEKLSVPAMAAGGVIISLGLHSVVDGIFYHAQSSFYMAIAFAVWMVPKK